MSIARAHLRTNAEATIEYMPLDCVQECQENTGVRCTVGSKLLMIVRIGSFWEERAGISCTRTRKVSLLQLNRRNSVFYCCILRRCKIRGKPQYLQQILLVDDPVLRTGKAETCMQMSQRVSTNVVPIPQYSLGVCTSISSKAAILWIEYLNQICNGEDF